MKDKEKAEKKLADEENKKRQKAEKEKQKKEAQLKKKQAQLKKQQTPMMKKDVSQNSKLNSYFTAKPTANSAEKENKEKEKIAAQVRIDRDYLSRRHQV